MSTVEHLRCELDEAGKARVRENIGLVGVNLRRIPRGSDPQSNRDREDLFQEGCLGLIRAAADFDEARGIPFAAFALPRINNAMCVARRTQSTLVRAPRVDAARRRKSAADPDRHHPFPRITALSDRQVEFLSARRAIDAEADERGRGETVGERIRGKYERAVRDVVAAETKVGSQRKDRAELVDVIARERLLVPDANAKHPLRRIARATSSSFGRVANCEQKLAAAVREALTADPEFVKLERLLRADPAGSRRVVDERLEADLVGAAAEAYVERFRAAPRAERAEMIGALLDRSPRAVESWIVERFKNLSAEQRESLARRMESGPTPDVAVKDKGLAL